MFQALTGCDTASVLILLDMDRKLHGMPAMELIARACYTACAALMYVQRIPPTHTALEQHVKSVVFQGGHVWGQIHVSHPVRPSLVHGTRLIMDYMNHTGPHFQDLLQSVTCGTQERMLYTIAAVSAKRLHALLSAGVKQLGKEIIVVLQFYTSFMTTEQAMQLYN